MVAVRGLRPLHPRQHLRVLVWMCKHQWTNQYLYEVTMTEITICETCNGNGFVRVPHAIYADQWEVGQCNACNSSGEVQASNEEPEDRR